MTSGRRAMSTNFRQEQMSLSYVRAVIFGAGFNLSRYEVDDHGIDGTIRSYTRGRNRVDFQLKATTKYDVRDSNIAYDLRVENYNQLIESDGLPQVLILFTMSENDNFWVSQNHYEMNLRKCAYWVCLMGRQLSNNSSTVRVELPIANIFDQNGLQRMFDQLLNRRG